MKHKLACEKKRPRCCAELCRGCAALQPCSGAGACNRSGLLRLPCSRRAGVLRGTEQMPSDANASTALKPACQLCIGCTHAARHGCRSAPHPWPAPHTTRVKLPTNRRRFRALARAGWQPRARNAATRQLRRSKTTGLQKAQAQRDRDAQCEQQNKKGIAKVRAGAKACRPPSRCQPRRRRAAPPQLRSAACATACVPRR
jgi:hypothetical protein